MHKFRAWDSIHAQAMHHMQNGVNNHRMEWGPLFVFAEVGRPSFCRHRVACGPSLGVSHLSEESSAQLNEIY